MTLITARTAAATAYRDIDRSAAADRAAKAKAAADRSATTLAAVLDLPQAVLDKRKKGAEALAQLEQAHQAGIADRKGAAKQKLEAARAKLQMVRMFGGDPKAMARQAKRIAQEIREAAREYGAALQAEGGGATEAGGGAAPADTGRSDKGTADVAEPAGDQQGAGDAGQDPDASKTASAYQTAAADMAARGDKARAEREDIEKFKEGARDARRLIEEAIRRLKAQKASAQDIDALDGARRSMTDAVDDLEKISSDKVAAGESALAEPAVPPAPMVDISV